MQDIIIVEEQDLINIADSIRKKTGSTKLMSLLEMPTQIMEFGESFKDCEQAQFGANAEAEGNYSISSDRLNEIAAEAQRFTRTSEALNPAQILQSLKDAVDDNPFIEGCVPEVHSETATKIKPYCFYGDETLTSFSAPNVTSIGVNAFDGCSNLETASIPQVTSVTNYSFQNCSSLNTLDMPLVTSIGTYGFYNSGVKNVSFPELTSIGTYSFAECSELESFEAPLLTTIPASAFYNSGLTEFDFSEITTISSTENYGTFQGTKLTDVELPKVTSLNISCFQAIDTLEIVKAPLVTSIANKTFNSCSNLYAIDFPLATSIGRYAFQGCANLTEIHFAEITSCGISAFENCTSLTRCEFNKKVEFSDYALRNCTALETLILRGDTMSTLYRWSPSLSGSGIERGTGYVYVPRALLDTYKADICWKNYANQIRAIEDYPDVCEGKEVIREYVFDTSKESEYTFDRNYVDSSDGYSLRTEYDCEFTEEEIDSGNMVSVNIDVNLADLAKIESMEVE